MTKKARFRIIKSIFTDCEIKIPEKVPGKTESERNKYTADRKNCLLVYDILNVTNFSKFLYPGCFISAEPSRDEIDFTNNVLNKLKIPTEKLLPTKEGIIKLWACFSHYHKRVFRYSGLFGLLEDGLLNKRYKLRKSVWNYMLTSSEENYDKTFSAAVPLAAYKYQREFSEAELSRAVFYFIKKEKWYPEFQHFLKTGKKSSPTIVVSGNEAELVGYSEMFKKVLAFHKMDHLLSHEQVVELSRNMLSRHSGKLFDAFEYVIDKGKIVPVGELQRPANLYQNIFWYALADSLFLLHEKKEIPKTRQDVQKQLHRLGITDKNNKVIKSDFQTAFDALRKYYLTYFDSRNPDSELFRTTARNKTTEQWVWNAVLPSEKEARRKINVFLKENRCRYFY